MKWLILKLKRLFLSAWNRIGLALSQFRSYWQAASPTYLVIITVTVFVVLCSIWWFYEAIRHSQWHISFKLDRTWVWWLSKWKDSSLIAFVSFFAAVMFGIISALSLINTFKIIHNQNSRFSGYDKLLIKLTGRLEKLQKKFQSREGEFISQNDPPVIKIFSPSLVIGNISATNKYFNRYFDFFTRDPDVLLNFEVNIVTQVDFSMWHQNFINKQFTHFTDLLEKVSGDDELCIRDTLRDEEIATLSGFINKKYTDKWFATIDMERSLSLENGGLENGDKSFSEMKEDILKHIKKVRNNIDLMLKQKTPLEPQARARMLDDIHFFKLAAHRNTDLQAVKMLHSFVLAYGKEGAQERIKLLRLESSSNKTSSLIMAPLVAYQIANESFLSWIFPSPDLRKNDLLGQVSMEERDSAIVDGIMKYYSTSLKDLFGAKTEIVEPCSVMDNPSEYLVSEPLKEIHRYIEKPLRPHRHQ